MLLSSQVNGERRTAMQTMIGLDAATRREIGAAVQEAVEARIDDTISAADLVEEALLEVAEIHGISEDELCGMGYDDLAFSFRRSLLLDQESAANERGFGRAA
jgi:hypothetical protein